MSTTCDTRPLKQCFLGTGDIPPSLAKLLKELQLPFLDVPNPHDASWSFLKHAGVSCALYWADLAKVLSQLCEAGATPELSSMVQLYEQVAAECVRRPEVVEIVRKAFAETRVIYVPGKHGNGGSWVTRKDVLWLGNKAIYPSKLFIAGHYAEVSSGFDDLQTFNKGNAMLCRDYADW